MSDNIDDRVTELRAMFDADMAVKREHLAEVLRLMKEAGATRVDFYDEDWRLKRIEFAPSPQVFEVVTPKTDADESEPGGYETALERMARGGKKEALKT